jgi:hypothetical protein
VRELTFRCRCVQQNAIASHLDQFAGAVTARIGLADEPQHNVIGLGLHCLSLMDDSPPPPEASPPPPPPVTTGSPSDFLKNVVGKRVVVRLTSGVDYRGTFLLALCLEPGSGLL